MGISDRTLRFHDKNLDLATLTQQIKDYLEFEEFKVHAREHSEHGTLIQAKKGGFLAKFIDADRALTIQVTGSPNDVIVRVGIGRWTEHLAVAVFEALVFTEIFLIIDVAEVAWNFEIENKLIKEIRSFVPGEGEPAAPAALPAPVTPATPDDNA